MSTVARISAADRRSIVNVGRRVRDARARKCLAQECLDLPGCLPEDRCSVCVEVAEANDAAGTLLRRISDEICPSTITTKKKASRR